jgi:hypothetical protein
VAIFSLDAEYGVAPGVAKLLTDHLSQEIRDAGGFQRVVSSRELESVMGFEKQRQLMSCQSDSCMAELAGALGVDFILVGNVGKIGTSYLLNLKVLDVRNGTLVSGVSDRLRGESEEALLDGVKPAVNRLLAGKFGGQVPVSGVAESRPPPKTLPATRATAPSSPQGDGGKPPWAWGLVGLGVAVAGGGLLVGLTALAWAAVTGITALAPYVFAVPTGPFNGPARMVLLVAAPLLPLAAGVLSLALGGLVGLGGGAAVAVGVAQ